MNNDQLLKKIANSNPIDFGNIFNKSIELFKKVWVQGFVHLLISMVVVIPLIILMYIPIIAIAGFGAYEESHGVDAGQFEEMSIGLAILFGILMLIVIIVGHAFQFGITAHFYRVCKQVDLGKPQTSSYFMFFKGKYLKKIMTIGIASFGIILLATALCFFPLLYVIVPLQLLGVVFAFNPEISSSDLINASFKLGNKIWLTGFLLIIISSILAQMVGFILCFVGVYLTISFIYLPIYYMYKETIGFEEENDQEKGVLFAQ